MSRPDPMEAEVIELLNHHGIAFTRPERNKFDPTNLDFYLPAQELYLEVKQFHTPRIAAQLANVPAHVTAIVLVGPNCVRDLERLCVALQ